MDNILERVTIKNCFAELTKWRLNGEVTVYDMHTLRDALECYKLKLEQETSCSSNVKERRDMEIKSCEELLQKFTDYEEVEL